MCGMCREYEKSSKKRDRICTKPLSTKQTLYIETSYWARSCNHCCSGQAISITYSECVCVCVYIYIYICVCVCVCVCVCSLSQPPCKARAPYCHLWPAPLYNIFPHYLINGTVFEKKLPNTKCVFWFPLQRLSQTFLILRITGRDMIKNIYIGLYVKYLLFLPDSNEI